MGSKFLYAIAFTTSAALPFSEFEQARSQETETADPPYYQFFPQSPLHLGGGFSPNNLAKAKADCIDSKIGPLDGSNVTLDTYFTEDIVVSTDELKTKLTLDAKIDASYASFSAGGKYNFISDSLFSENSIIIVISAYSEYGRTNADPKTEPVKPPYRHLLKDPDGFEAVCGSRYVSAARNGASASAIITVFGLTKTEHDDIILTAHAGGGTGKFSGSAESTISKSIAKASKTNELKTKVVSTGGTGLDSLESLIKATTPHDDAITAIKSALASYLKGFNAQNAPPIGYWVIPMTFTEWKPNHPDLWTDHKEAILRDIVAEYRSVKSRLFESKEVLAGRDPRRALVPTSEDYRIKRNIKEYTKREGILAAAYERCKNDTTLDGTDCVMASFQEEITDPIPKAPPPPVGYFEISGLTENADRIVWDAIRSRAFLSGVTFYDRKEKFPWDAGGGPYIDTTTNMDQRMRGSGIPGASVKFVITGKYQIFQSLSVKIAGTPEYKDISPLSSVCCEERYDVRNNLGGRVEQYIRSDFNSLKGEATLDRSATFAIHVTDKLGRNYFLPFATGTWHRAQRPITVGYASDQSILIEPVL